MSSLASVLHGGCQAVCNKVIVSNHCAYFDASRLTPLTRATLLPWAPQLFVAMRFALCFASHTPATLVPFCQHHLTSFVTLFLRRRWQPTDDSAMLLIRPFLRFSLTRRDYWQIGFGVCRALACQWRWRRTTKDNDSPVALTVSPPRYIT